MMDDSGYYRNGCMLIGMNHWDDPWKFPISEASPSELAFIINGSYSIGQCFPSVNGTSFDPNASGNWLWISSFDISPTFLLLSIFFGLLYFWWKSEDTTMMIILTMLIVPYDFVVMTTYLLPLYITDATILVFLQGILIILGIIIMGYTIEKWDSKRRNRRNA